MTDTLHPSTPLTDASRLERLAAHVEIHEVLNAYCQGVDRRDWEQVRSCYHDDARDSHGPFRGNRDELVKWMEGNHHNVTFCMHMIGNVAINLSAEDPRLARTDTYCLSHKTVASADNDPYFQGAGVDGELRRTIACRYVDTFENRPGVGWRILERTVVHEWMRREPNELYVPIDPALAISRRDRTDLLYSPLPTRSAAES